MASRTQTTVIGNFQGQRRDMPLRNMDANILQYGLNVGFYRGSLYRTSGYGKFLLPAASITSITRSGTTATATTAAAHNLSADDTVTIYGASPSGYNLTATVLSAPSATEFTYTVDSGLSTPATGTITYSAGQDLGEPVQTLFPTRMFDRTDRLIVATEGDLWMNNSAGTALINHNHKDQSGSQIGDYTASTTNVWSLTNYLNKIYATQYGFVPTRYNVPQVSNGDYTQGSTVAISGTPTWASNELTINTSTAHSLSTNDVIEVAGLTGTTYNPIGTFQCIVVDTDTVKIQLFTNPGTIGTATPTIRKTHYFGSAYVPVSGFKAKVVRSFENHLMYFNIYDGSADQPMTFYYSDIGAPTTWSGGDSSFSAIPDGGDGIVTAEIIPPYLAIYKERSIWLLSYTGGSFIWQNKIGAMNYGAFGSRSVISIGDRHYFMAKDKYGLFDGFYQFNGSYPEPMENMDGIREFMKDEIDTNNPEMVYVDYSGERQEIRWHYVSASATTAYPNSIICYNLHDKTWHFEDAGNANGELTCGAEFELTASTTIDQLDNFASTIDTLPYPMDSVYYNGKRRYMLFGDSSGRIYVQNNATTFDGTAISSSIYRNDFYLDDNKNQVKYVTKVILIFKDLGITSSVTFKLGSRLTEGSDTISWSSDNTITLASGRTNYRVNLMKPGKLFSWQLTTSANDPGFQLEQIIIEYVNGGNI